MIEVDELRFANPMENLISPGKVSGLGSDGLTTEHSILQSLALTATSALAGIFVIRVLEKEKNSVWRIVGVSVLAGSAFGVLSGIARIIAHFAPKKP